MPSEPPADDSPAPGAAVECRDRTEVEPVEHQPGRVADGRLIVDIEHTLAVAPEIRPNRLPRLRLHPPLGRRQEHRERRTLTGLGVNVDVSAMPADDACDSEEPEARAAVGFLRREEGLENPIDDFGRDAGTRVRHTDDNVA